MERKRVYAFSNNPNGFYMKLGHKKEENVPQTNRINQSVQIKASLPKSWFFKTNPVTGKPVISLTIPPPGDESWSSVEKEEISLDEEYKGIKVYQNVFFKSGVKQNILYCYILWGDGTPILEIKHATADDMFFFAQEMQHRKYEGEYPLIFQTIGDRTKYEIELWSVEKWDISSKREGRRMVWNITYSTENPPEPK